MKKQIKTVKGLVSYLKRLDDGQTFQDLKGYDKLTDDQKEALSFISGDVSNFIGEFQSSSTQKH